MFNRNINNASLFGNANTSTPTSTPTPTTNTFQLPSKSGGLFGNANTSINASSPSPAGGLFGNNAANQNDAALNTQKPQANGGLFGANNKSSPSLFGNAANNKFTQNTSSNLFSKPSTNTQFTFGTKDSIINSSQSNQNSLFSSQASQTKPAGLFGANTLGTQTNSLFGNAQSTNSDSGNNQLSANSNSVNTNPYGISIGSGPVPISTMPASITASLPSGKNYSTKNLDNSNISPAEHHRSSSISSNSNYTIAQSLPPYSHSSLIKNLSTRLKTGQNVSSTQGIFSPIQKRTWSIEDQGTNLNNGSKKNLNTTNNISGSYSSKELAIFAMKKNDLSEMRKLKIDPTRSTAKKQRLFSGKSNQTKIHDSDNVGHDSYIDSNNELISQRTSDAPNEYAYASDNQSSAIAPSVENKLSGNTTKNASESTYWSSPSPEQLSMLTNAQLMAVPGFVIGRKGYGYITFNYDVDLRAFSNDFETNLFGNIVKFHPSKTVEVYPDETKKPSVGNGINVPATITLENIYPINKKTKKSIKDPTKFKEIQILVKKLKNMRNMEYISYNPFGGVWTFKVNHFSIWGLINNEDAEIEEGDIKENDEKFKKGRDFVYPKQRRGLAQSNKTRVDDVPGSFAAPDSTLTESNTQEHLLKLQDRSHIDFNGDALNLSEEPPLEEKPYEPEVVEEDFEGLEAEPSLGISNDWIEQLKLASSNMRSIFAPTRQIFHHNVDEMDMLFTEVNRGIELENKIKKERRMETESFGLFSNHMTIIKKDTKSHTGVKILNLASINHLNFELFSSVFTKHLHLSVVNERSSNDYPQMIRNSLQFKDIVALCKSPDVELWRLCSILFDSTRLSYDVHEESIREILLKKERYKELCSWITRQISEEIDQKLEKSNNALDGIFLHLAKNDIISASKLAIQSQNGHLAILISLLGSNDSKVKLLASRQLEKWNTAGRKVDSRVARIYKLLTGDIRHANQEPGSLNKEFSWLCLLGLDLFFGKVDEYSLKDFIGRHMKLFNPCTNDKRSMILKLFSTHETHHQFLAEIKVAATVFDETFLWYFVQIMRFNNYDGFSADISDRLTLDLIAKLRIASLYSESLFTACFLTDDTMAKKQINSIIFHEISALTRHGNDDILVNLKISQKLIYRAQALWDQYNGDFLSQAQNLIKSEDFKEAEKIIVTAVGPKLILNGKLLHNETDLQMLQKLLSSFPRNAMEKWNEGLGVYENYLKLLLSGIKDENNLNLLLDGLHIFFEKNKQYKQIVVCCNVMAQDVSTVIIEDNSNRLAELPSERLFNLPLGHPEKKYLKNLLSGTK